MSINNYEDYLKQEAEEKATYKVAETSIANLKKQKLLAAVKAKKLALDPVHEEEEDVGFRLTNVPENAVDNDGDNIWISRANKKSSRVVFGKDRGYSFDAPETSNTKFKSNTGSFVKQKFFVARKLGIDPLEVTEEDIFKEGELSRIKLEEGINAGFNPNSPHPTSSILPDGSLGEGPAVQQLLVQNKGKGAHGRDLVNIINPYTGKNIAKELSTPENNTDFSSKYNVLNRKEYYDNKREELAAREATVAKESPYTIYKESELANRSLDYKDFINAIAKGYDSVKELTNTGLHTLINGSRELPDNISKKDVDIYRDMLSKGIDITDKASLNEEQKELLKDVQGKANLDFRTMFNDRGESNRVGGVSKFDQLKKIDNIAEKYNKMQEMFKRTSTANNFSAEKTSEISEKATKKIDASLSRMQINWGKGDKENAVKDAFAAISDIGGMMGEMVTENPRGAWDMLADSLPLAMASANVYGFAVAVNKYFEDDISSFIEKNNGNYPSNEEANRMRVSALFQGGASALSGHALKIPTGPNAGAFLDKFSGIKKVAQKLKPFGSAVDKVVPKRVIKASFKSKTKVQKINHIAKELVKFAGKKVLKPVGKVAGGVAAEGTEEYFQNIVSAYGVSGEVTQKDVSEALVALGHGGLLGGSIKASTVTGTSIKEALKGTAKVSGNTAGKVQKVVKNAAAKKIQDINDNSPITQEELVNRTDKGSKTYSRTAAVTALTSSYRKSENKEQVLQEIADVKKESIAELQSTNEAYKKAVADKVPEEEVKKLREAYNAANNEFTEIAVKTSAYTKKVSNKTVKKVEEKLNRVPNVKGESTVDYHYYEELASQIEDTTIHGSEDLQKIKTSLNKQKNVPARVTEAVNNAIHITEIESSIKGDSKKVSNDIYQDGVNTEGKAGLLRHIANIRQAGATKSQVAIDSTITELKSFVSGQKNKLAAMKKSALPVNEGIAVKYGNKGAEFTTPKGMSKRTSILIKSTIEPELRSIEETLSYAESIQKSITNAATITDTEASISTVKNVATVAENIVKASVKSAIDTDNKTALKKPVLVDKVKEDVPLQREMLLPEGKKSIKKENTSTVANISKTVKVPVKKNILKRSKKEVFAASAVLDEANDSLLTAAAKKGGLNLKEWVSEGVDPASSKDNGGTKRILGRPVFRKNGGMAADALAEFANENGYGKDLSANDVLELVLEELNGNPAYTSAGKETQAAKNHQEHLEDKARQQEESSDSTNNTDTVETEPLSEGVAESGRGSGTKTKQSPKELDNSGKNSKILQDIYSAPFVDTVSKIGKAFKNATGKTKAWKNIAKANLAQKISSIVNEEGKPKYVKNVDGELHLTKEGVALVEELDSAKEHKEARDRLHKETIKNTPNAVKEGEQEFAKLFEESVRSSKKATTALQTSIAENKAFTKSPVIEKIVQALRKVLVEEGKVSHTTSESDLAGIASKRIQGTNTATDVANKESAESKGAIIASVLVGNLEVNNMHVAKNSYPKAKSLKNINKYASIPAKAAKSILGRTVNFIAEYKYMEEVANLPKEERASLDDLVIDMSKIAEEFKKVASTMENANYINNVHENIGHMYVNQKDKSISEVLAQNAALHIINWLGTEGSNTVFNTDMDIQRFLQKDTRRSPAKVEQAYLQHIGSPVGKVFPSIGKNILKDTGIVFGENTPADVELRLTLAIGKMAVMAAQKAGMVEFNQLDKTALEAVDQATNFVRMKSDPVSEEAPYASPIDSMKVLIKEHGTTARKSIMSKLFNTDTVHLVPSDTSPTKVNIALGDGVGEASTTLEEGAKEYQKVPWKKNMSFMGILGRLDNTTIFKIGEYAELSEVTTSEELGQIAKNTQIMRDTFNMKAFFNSREDVKPFYYKVHFIKNTRAMLMGSMFNMQSSILHRAATDTDSWHVTIPRKGKGSRKLKDSLKLAISANLGNKVEQGTEKTWVKHFNETIMDAAGNIKDPVLKAAVTAVNETGSISSKGQEAIVKAALKSGETFKSINALTALAELQKFVKNPKQESMETNITREIDGITNGIVIGIMQLPTNILKALDIVSRGGLHTSNVNGKTHGEITENTSLDDNYKALIKSSIAYRDRIIELSGGMLTHNFRDKDNILPLSKSYNPVDVEMLFGELVEKTAENMYTVTPEGRKLGKTSLMPSAYSKSPETNTKELVEEAVQKLLNRMYKLYVKGDMEEVIRLKRLIIKVTGIDFKMSKAELKSFSFNNTATNSKDWGAYQNIKRYLEEVVEAYYAIPLEYALRSRLRDFIKNTSVLNDGIHYMEAVFKAIYESRVEEAIEENGGVDLSKKAYKKITKDLQKEGLIPGIAYSSSTRSDFSDQLDLTKQETVYRDTKDGGTVTIKFSKSNEIQMNVFKPNAKGIPTKYKRSQSSMTTSTRHVAPTGDIGISAMANIVQSGDSYVNTLLAGLSALANSAGVHAFDGYSGSIENIVKNGKMANKLFKELHENWSVMQEVINKIVIVRKAHAALPVHTRQALKKKLFTSGNKSPLNYIRERSKEEINDAYIGNNFLNHLLTEADLIVQSQKELVGLITYYEQYAIENGGVVVENTPKIDSVEAELKKLYKEAKEETQGSEEVDFDITEENYPNKNKMTADTIEDLFDELNTVGNVSEDAGHVVHLKELIKEVLKPALTNLNRSILVNRNNSSPVDRTVGAIDSSLKNIYINTSAGKSTDITNISAQEALIHETVHALWKYSINNIDSVYNKVRDMKNNVQKVLEKSPDPWKILLPVDKNGDVVYKDPVNSDVENQSAKDRYDYIFNSSKSGLHEFATYGLTNAAFIKALEKVNIKSKSSKSDTGNTVKDVLMDILNTVVDFISNTVNGHVKSISVHKALRGLAKDLDNVKKVNNMKTAKASAFVTGIESKLDRALIDHIVEPYNRYVEKTLEDASAKPRIVKFATNVIGIPHGIMSGNIYKGIKDIMSSYNISKDSMLYNLLTEIAGQGPITAKWFDLLRKSKHILDSQRKHIIDGTRKQTRNAFDPENPLEDEDLEHLQSSVIKTNMHYLLEGRSRQEVINLLEDPSKIEVEEKRIRTLVKNTFKKEQASYYIAQGNGLGRTMAQGGKGEELQAPNAYIIAKMSFTDKKALGDLVLAESLIEQLASLSAMKFTSVTANKNTAEIMAREYAREVEVNGVEFMLAQHVNYKKVYLEKVLKGNKNLVRAEVSFENYDKNISHKLLKNNSETFVDEEAELIRVGYKKVSSTGGSYSMYVSTIKMQQAYVSGISSTSTIKKVGSSVLQGLSGKDYYAANDDFIENMSRAGSFGLKNQYAGIVKEYKRNTQGKVDLDNIVPMADENGRIGEYRRVFSEYTKVTMLGKKDMAHEVLARMVGGLLDIKKTPEINKEILLTAKEDYDRDYINNPNDYVLISKFNKENHGKYAEIARMMPKTMHEDMHEIWGEEVDKGFYVKKELVNTIFGFRKLSMIEAIDAKLKKHTQIVLNRQVYIASKTAGIIWQKIISKAKRNIVILMPQVVFANTISNQILLTTKGVPMEWYMKKQLEALRELDKYQKLLEQKDNLKRFLEVNKTIKGRKNKEQKLKLMEQDLERNAVSKLIDEGLFQTMIEDIAETDDSIIDAITSVAPSTGKYIKGNVKKLKQNKIGKRVVQTHDVITMAQNTYVGKLAAQATQYSDFVSRYALYTYRTSQEGKNHLESIRETVETFIDYDTNTSAQIQYLNDMGLFMFTKFLLRIQRVLFSLLKEKPAMLIGSELLNAATFDASTIVDANMVTKDIVGRFGVDNALETAKDSYMLALFGWLPFI